MVAPKWYSQYRFYLSILVGTCIIGSLAATSYWGPVGGHGFLSHELEMVGSFTPRINHIVDWTMTCDRSVLTVERDSLLTMEW